VVSLPLDLPVRCGPWRHTLDRMGPGTPRGAVTAGLLIAGCTIAWLSACGLSLSGLSNRLDDGGGNAIVDASHRGEDGQGDGSTQPPCDLLDAACLGALPPAWQPIGIGDGGCAHGYTAENLVTNPRLADGGCACGACQVIGSYGCDASVAISGGDNNCGDPPFMTATPGICAAGQAQHVEAHVSTATGSVGCLAANVAGAGAVIDPLTLCVPGCGTDYCQAGQRCIAADGELSCPAGYTLLTRAGQGAETSCAPCTCDAGPPGTCAGTVAIYSDTACSDAGLLALYTAGSCNEYSSDYNSVLVELAAPPPSCSAPTTAEGDASLTGMKTICCQ
jgi:hypothetical protein